MEIVYTVDLKIPNDGIQLKNILTTDVSCLNILAFSCSYLPILNQLKYNPYLEHQIDKSSFCVYVCALEQPWYFHLITTSNVPFIQLVWSLDGTHLLTCNQTGVCQVFQIKVNSTIYLTSLNISFRMVVLIQWRIFINMKSMKIFYMQNIFFL